MIGEFYVFFADRLIIFFLRDGEIQERVPTEIRFASIFVVRCHYSYLSYAKVVLSAFSKMRYRLTRSMIHSNDVIRIMYRLSSDNKYREIDMKRANTQSPF